MNALIVKRRTVIHHIAIIVISILLSGCMQFDPLRGAVGSYRNYTDVNAKIENDVLYDPYGRFSIQVPYLLKPGAVIRGQLDENRGTVEFSDDLGNFTRIDVFTANNPVSMEMFARQDWQVILKQNRTLMQYLYRSACPQTQAVHQEYLALDERHIDFYVFSLTEGATVADAKGKRYDALRASISLLEGASVFTISTQYVTGLPGESRDQSESIEWMKKQLFETLATMSFKK